METDAIVYAIRTSKTGAEQRQAADDQLSAIMTALAVKEDVLKAVERTANDVEELADYDKPPEGWIAKADSALTVISSEAKAALTDAPHGAVLWSKAVREEGWIEVDGVKVPFTAHDTGGSCFPCAPGEGPPETSYRCALCNYEFAKVFDPFLLMHSSFAQEQNEINDKIRRHLEFGHSDWRDHVTK